MKQRLCLDRHVKLVQEGYLVPEETVGDQLRQVASLVVSIVIVLLLVVALAR